MQSLFPNLLPWSHLRYNFKILPEHQLQNLEQTLKPYPQSPNKNLTLWPKLIFQICTKLLSTCFSSSTSTTVTTSTSFELPSPHARVTLIKFTEQEWVSESVSYWQALPMIGLGSDKKSRQIYPLQVFFYFNLQALTNLQHVFWTSAEPPPPFGRIWKKLQYWCGKVPVECLLRHAMRSDSCRYNFWPKTMHIKSEKLIWKDIQWMM